MTLSREKLILSREKTVHTLEILGPRGQIWRPVVGIHGELLREALVLAGNDRPSEAILKAQDLWTEKHGSLQGVSFRVHTVMDRLCASSFGDLGDLDELCDVTQGVDGQPG